ncbi:MAG: hypothetical protein JST32_00070 [Bacteroidetes bacterium]|nr:hypothetical protein [Bacteroidota bacterium]
MEKLNRFWFEFDQTCGDLPPGVKWGCGITAWTYDDAVNILRSKVFKGRQLQVFKKVIENVDVSTLDAGHVLPNILTPTSVRGVWFPMGYDD